MFDRYEPLNFEAKWRKRWADADLFRTREEAGRPKFYGLDFFPYPSGAGLSVGHCRNYIPTDVLCRMRFMQGYNVLHPMGFDAFGLPAENEAIKRRRHPEAMVHEYGATYKRQMDLIGIGYDWSRSFYSSDPSYYKWTQWIFKKLYEKGLAYRANAAVNWCPKDKTALANEEVVGGLCERCGTPVERREIPQWFFRITEYAQRLLDDLDDLDWPEGIKNQQRNWIGRSEGVEFEMRVAKTAGSGRFDLESEQVKAEAELRFRVFTTRIDTIFGMSFCVLAPEHSLVEQLLLQSDEEHKVAVAAYIQAAKALGDTERQAADRIKTGVDTGFKAINPATGKPVPIFVADYVLMGYGTGAIMAVPGHDQRDFDFASKYDLAILPVIAPSVEDPDLAIEAHANGKAFEPKDGVLINSGEYTGQSVAEAQHNLGVWMESLGLGERKVNYRIRDWLISRQRYWGCPIPILHDQDGSLEAVSDDALPVELPAVDSYEPGDDGASPLASIPEFLNATNGEGRLARRETDTMGGFACSSWYFLRFCDPVNYTQAWDPAKVAYWMPVDCYVGGAEHAVMHLLYARFWTKVLFDLGLVPVKEPFARLQNQGQVLGYTPYRSPRPGETLEFGDTGILVSFEEANQLPDHELQWRWVRMSKSKGNVVTPDEAVEQYGADALRVYELFVAPFEADVQWSNEGMQGAVRFLSKVCRLVSVFAPRFRPKWREELGGEGKDIRRWTHQTIRKVTDDVERFAFNTAVSTLMIYVNNLSDAINRVGVDAELSEAMESLILLLSPIAPHTADELWEGLGRTGFTYHEAWPKADSALAADDEVTIAVQVNGKLRDTITVAAGTSDADLEAAAMGSEKAVFHMDGKEIRKVIVVPGKLVNIVVAN
ncbi:MAG: leucine--tRNA ligase [Fimbriimonadaceae bacterium]|nr:leucine--tRNA ligase [Fimbriimonadaceae bacterium]